MRRRGCFYLMEFEREEGGRRSREEGEEQQGWMMGGDCL